MVGGTAITPNKPNPNDGWLSIKQWAIIEEVSLTIPILKGIDQDFINNSQKWKGVYLSNEPYCCPEWPSTWNSSLNCF